MGEEVLEVLTPRSPEHQVTEVRVHRRLASSRGQALRHPPPLPAQAHTQAIA